MMINWASWDVCMYVCSIYLFLLFYFQNDTLSYYSTYSVKDLSDTMKKIAKLVIKAESSKLTVSTTVFHLTIAILKFFAIF